MRGNNRSHMNLTSKFIFSIVAASLLLLVGCNAKETTKIVVFQNVNLITMTEDRVVENQSVVIKDGLIAEIGAFQSVTIPKGAQIIEGEGKYLMPGLVDMHVHPWRYSGEEFLFLANGITTIQNMWGFPQDLETRAAIKDGKIVGPRIFTTGSIMDGPNPVWKDSTVLETPEEARQAVISVQEEGYDAVKVYERLTVEVYEEIMKTADEIGIKVMGHVPHQVGIGKVLELGQDSIDHLSGYSLENIEDEAEMTAENKVWNTPTLAVTHILKMENEIEGLEYISPDIIRSWRNLKRMGKYAFDLEKLQHMVGIIHGKGGKLLAGTDANNPFIVPGFSLHSELEYLAGAGLTPYEALKTATYNPAEFLGQLDQFGTVEEGKEADLILLSKNPLEDIKNTRSLEGTMVRGLWLNNERLQEELKKIKENH